MSLVNGDSALFIALMNAGADIDLTLTVIPLFFEFINCICFALFYLKVNFDQIFNFYLLNDAILFVYLLS